MSNCENLTITPINKSEKSKSNIDYAEQLERTATGDLNWCWMIASTIKQNQGNISRLCSMVKK